MSANSGETGSNGSAGTDLSGQCTHSEVATGSAYGSTSSSCPLGTGRRRWRYCDHLCRCQSAACCSSHLDCTKSTSSRRTSSPRQPSPSHSHPWQSHLCSGHERVCPGRHRDAYATYLHPHDACLHGSDGRCSSTIVAYHQAH